MAEMDYLPGGIKERLEDLRNRRKLTLKEVAEKTGIDYSTLSRIENGNVKKVGDDTWRKSFPTFGGSPTRQILHFQSDGFLSSKL